MEPSSAAAVEQPLGYMAREWDAHAGLYQVRARWYDPQQGRFVSEDPIGLEGGMNLYGYAANSPVNFTDPSGMCPESSKKPVDVDTDGDGKVDAKQWQCPAGRGVPIAGVSNIRVKDPAVVFVGYGGNFATPVGGATASAGYYQDANGDQGLFFSGGYAFGKDASYGPIAGYANAFSNFEKGAGLACAPHPFSSLSACAAGSPNQPNVAYVGRAVNASSFLGGGFSAGETYTWTVNLGRVCNPSLQVNAPDLCPSGR